MTTQEINLQIHESRITRNEEDILKIWEKMTYLERALARLIPVWVALVLMAMSALTGSALTFASMMAKTE